MKKEFILSSVLILVLAALIVQASISTSVSNDLTRAVNKTVVAISNPGNDSANLTLSIPAVVDSQDNLMQFTVTPSIFFNLAPGNTTYFNVSYTSFPDDFDLGSYAIPLTVNSTSNGNTSTTEVPIIVVSDWCAEGATGSNVSITSVKDVSSDNDWEWRPLDYVDVEVKVKNNAKDDLDVTVELDLYDEDNNEFIGFQNSDSTEDTISISDGDSETFEFNVQIPVDAERGAGRYVLYVKAYEDGNEEEQCKQKTQDVEIKRESRQISLIDISAPNLTQCSSSVEVSTSVANIGRDNEDKVKIVLRNSELGLSQTREISNLDSTDNPKDISFSFQVPANATEKDYTLSFDVYFDYKKSSGNYQDSQTGVASANLRVRGSCSVQQANVSIIPSLESEAAEGKELTVSTIIRNTGNSAATYALAISGFDSWAENAQLSQNTISLNAGESKSVTITLTPKSGSAGEQSFTITASSNVQTQNQRVVLTVAKSSGLSFSFLGNNWYLWLIIAVNVVLIVIIIIVAVTMSKR
jgi:hypothetical protein